jgi:hypothetical protein
MSTPFVVVGVVVVGVVAVVVVAVVAVAPVVLASVVVPSVGVSSVGESLPLPPRPGSELAAATPANTRIALMMIAAFVIVVSLLPSEVEFSSVRVAEGSPSAGYAKAKPR